MAWNGHLCQGAGDDGGMIRIGGRCRWHQQVGTVGIIANKRINVAGRGHNDGCDGGGHPTESVVADTHEAQASNARSHVAAEL